MSRMTTQLAHARPDVYDDDPGFDYRAYWTDRSYEHAAEEAAIRRLLAGRHVTRAVDVGGGYGRLTRLLAEYADRVVLAEPSRHQLELSRQHLAGVQGVERRRVAAADLRMTPASVDLVMMVRVMHHLPDPRPEIAEFARVLRPGGLLLLEFANSANALRRLRCRRSLARMPRDPVDIRSAEGSAGWEVPFVNHHPYRVLSLVERQFMLERQLSVSNLRSGTLKRLLPARLMIACERRSQPALAPLWFGPSMWLLLRRRAD